MKARRLAKLKVTRVDLVEKGANPDAHVTLLKNEAGERVEKGQCLECPNCRKRLALGYGDSGSELPNYCGECGAEIKLTASGGTGVEKSMKNDETKGEPTADQLKADLAKAQERIAAFEKAEKDAAEKAKAAGTSTEDVLKSLEPAARAIVEKAQADAAKATADAAAAQAAVLKMEDERNTREFEDRAAAIKGVPGFDRKNGGAILKALSGLVQKSEDGKTVLEQVEVILKAASESIRKGGLFQENGTATTGAAGEDPLAQLNAIAEDIRKSDAKLTDQEALAKAIEQRPELYAKHQDRQRAVRREAH